MPETHLTTRTGGTRSNPSAEEMRFALSELAVSDPDHPDCWLSDEDGWTVGAHENGTAVLENVESLEGPWHLKFDSPETVLEIWLALQAGDLDAVRNHSWQDGYGC